MIVEIEITITVDPDNFDREELMADIKESFLERTGYEIDTIYINPK